MNSETWKDPRLSLGRSGGEPGRHRWNPEGKTCAGTRRRERSGLRALLGTIELRCSAFFVRSFRSFARLADGTRSTTRGEFLMGSWEGEGRGWLGRYDAIK